MFKMNEENPMVDQVYEFQMIAYEICNEGIQVYEQMQVASIIYKLPKF